jgi:hypothetical protein
LRVILFFLKRFFLVTLFLKKNLKKNALLDLPLYLFLKKNFNIRSVNKKKKILSTKTVLLKKKFLLKLLNQQLFQYMYIPERFKIGKFD